MNFSQGFENAWNDVVSFLPDLLAFLVVLLIGYIIAKVIAKAIDKVLEKVGFDKAVQRGGVAKAMSKSNYDASDLVSKIAFYGLFLIVLQAAFAVFGENPVSDLLNDVIAYLPNVIAAIVIIVVAAAIAAAVREIVRASIGGLSYGPALATAAGVAILAVGVFAALTQLQIAPAIVTGLFYAILASIVGVTVVAVGGGGIKPMQSAWERTVNKVQEETPKMQQQASGTKERLDIRAQELRQQAQSATGSTGSSQQES